MLGSILHTVKLSLQIKLSMLPYCEEHWPKFLLDDSLFLEPRVTTTFKSAFYHLRNTNKIRGFDTPDTTESTVHAFQYNLINWLLYLSTL